MNVLSILVGKVLIWLTRLNGGHGSAFPGLVVEKLNPRIIKTMVKQLPDGVVFVTGTNGKTTSTKILVGLLEGVGKKVLTNQSGSNFTRGIISTLVAKAKITGKLDFDIAVIEVDEAYSPILAKAMQPKAILALNVHRDQLDRYGEIDTTAQTIGRAMDDVETIVVNADEPLLVKEAKARKSAKKVYFGLSQKLIDSLPTDSNLHSDQPSKKSQRPKLDVELTTAKRQGVRQAITLKFAKETHKVDMDVLGVHNAANATAAVAMAEVLCPGHPLAELVEHLRRAKPAFGRGEHFEINSSDLWLGLVKNPAGFNQNLDTLVNEGTTDVLFVVNDNYADGRDVSWLWDIDFARKLAELNDTHVYVSGIRAYDMAVRLQQEGIELAVVNTNIKQVLSEVLVRSVANRNIVIMPTYTAMLEVRELLKTYQEEGTIWQ